MGEPRRGGGWRGANRRRTMRESRGQRRGGERKAEIMLVSDNVLN